MNKLFDCDIDLFSIFKQQIIEPDFCLLLKKYYIEEGKYNKHKLYELEDKIKQLKNNIQLYPNNTKIKNYYFSLIKKFNSLNESYSLLNSIIRYNQLLNNNYYIDNELKLSIDNNINEFISREKYYVTGYKDGVNDNRTLFYEVDNNFNKKINYKQLHYLISIIQMYILNKEKKAIENSCNNFEKQLSLF